MAKFKVGDKVRHVDDGQDGPVGVVKGVYGDGKIKVKFPGLMKDGFDGFEEEELVMANGCARNAKFKVGDKVIWTQFGGKPMLVVDMNDKGEYLCRTHDGNEVVFSEEKLKIANSDPLASTNAVVQNAINARRARNAMAKIDDAEGAKRWDALWVKAAELKREAEALDKYLVSKKQYGYSAKLESLAKALTGF